MNAYREAPSATIDFFHRWTGRRLDARDADGELALAAAAIDGVIRAALPLALHAQGFENEAWLLRSLEPLSDAASVREAMEQARDAMRTAARSGMRFYHALGSAALAAEFLLTALIRATDEASKRSVVDAIFGISGPLDVAAYRAISAGTPRERVVELFREAIDGASIRADLTP